MSFGDRHCEHSEAIQFWSFRDGAKRQARKSILTTAQWIPAYPGMTGREKNSGLLRRSRSSQWRRALAAIAIPIASPLSGFRQSPKLARRRKDDGFASAQPILRTTRCLM